LNFKFLFDFNWMFGEGGDDDLTSILFGPEEPTEEEIQQEKPNLKRKIEELNLFQTQTKFQKLELNPFSQEEKLVEEKEDQEITENENNETFMKLFGEDLPLIEEIEEEEDEEEEEPKVVGFKIKIPRKESQRLNDEKKDFRKILKLLEEQHHETTLNVQTKIYSSENETIEESKEELMKEILKMKEMDKNKMESIFNSIDSVISLLKYSNGFEFNFLTFSGTVGGFEMKKLIKLKIKGKDIQLFDKEYYSMLKNIQK
jgi:hypothetical protein